MIKYFFKYIWEYFPSILKKTIFPSSIVIAIMGNALSQYLNSNEVNISYSAVKTTVFIFLSLSFFILIFGYIIALHRVSFHFIGNKNSNDSSQVTNKKKITSRFEIEILNDKIIEFTAFIKRKWYPNESRPGIEDFLRALEFSEPRCGICHSDFYIDYDQIKSYQCKNSNCESSKKIYEKEMYQISKQIEGNFKGEIRNKYDNYWQKYKKKYNEFTNKKYLEYWDPI